MSKRVEFHQANITASFRIVDDERSYGLQQADLQVLMNTEADWLGARDSVRQALEQLNAKLQEAEGNANGS